jgi:hypothetical protein
MAIARYENIDVNNVTNSINLYGEQTTTVSKWFTTRAQVADVNNNLRISERYRVYSDLVNLTLNFTPNTKQMVDEQNLFAITWRGYDWRIIDCRESNDRMNVTFICYRNDPSAPV